MNTSKSLKEILRAVTNFKQAAVDKAQEESVFEIDLERANEILDGYIDEAATAIVEAVEGLIPPEKDTQITVEQISETARITQLHPQAQGFNECRDLVLQAIKEWQ
jgi:hypothetical protein